MLHRRAAVEYFGWCFVVLKGRDLTLLGIGKGTKASIDKLLSGVLVRLEVEGAAVHGGNEQVIAVDVDSAEHLSLPKRTDSGQEIKHGLDEVGIRGHVDGAQRLA